MSLDDIWDEPVASPPKSILADGHSSPLKRPRQSLFLSDSDSDYERPPKRATPAPPPEPRPDVEAMFADLDKDGDGNEDDDLSYKPLAPTLDLEKLAKEAEARHARGRQGASSQALSSGSTQKGAADGKGKDHSGKDDGKGDGEKKARKKLPKLDEERLVGPDGFPQLIKDIKGFKIHGKGHEHQDLNRVMQVYQFWSHKMYPKTSFKDTVGRVEKLCHSKRMQVRLSVWRDEFKGVVNGKKPDEDDDDPDVINLTEPTLVGTADDGDHDKDPLLESKSDRASSRAPSFPPTSSEVGDDDDFDIEAAIKAEEERLATLRGTSTGSTTQVSSAPKSTESSRRENSDSNAMDVDEEGYWAAFDDEPQLLDPPKSTTSSSAPPLDDDEDMWAIVNEIEQGGSEQRPKPTKNQIQIPLSGVNMVPSSETASSASGEVSRATNDDDWDEMYS